jgi:DNA modification methylase
MDNIARLHDCTLIKGDCVEETAKMESESVGLSIFSPPFPEMYVYNKDKRDMGNSKSFDELMMHMGFLVPELFRVMKQGRNVCIHCMDTPIQKGKHGYIGLKDFSGLLIQLMESVGFVYHSRITIWKNPVTEMQRTKALGLLHKQTKKDSTMSRVGIPDYVLVFRKDGERNNPVKMSISVDTWQQFASPVWQFENYDSDFEMILPLLGEENYMQLPVSVRNKYSTPVWMDIDYGKTLNTAVAKEERDEKHICPLQLPTIERLTIMYSNEGDTIYTPFLGIGSEPYQALLMNRKAIGVELKHNYWKISVRNCKNALEKRMQTQLIA